MKKILLSFLLMLLLGLASKLQAQCELSISNVSYELVGDPVNAGPGKCQYTVNVQFDLSYNSGSKFVYFHLFRAADYPTAINNPDLDGPGNGNKATAFADGLFGCSAGSSNNRTAPDRDQLGTLRDQADKSFLDIGLDNQSGHGTLNTIVDVPVLTTYQADAGVVLAQPSNSPGLTVTKTFIGGTTDHFQVTNLQVIVNQACNTLLDVVAAGWATNSANGANAQCYFCGLPQTFNDPKIAGFKTCSTPRTYTLGITTNDPVPSTLTYSVWVDMDNNGAISAGDIEAVGPINYPNFSNVNAFTTGGPVEYAPYSNQAGVASRDLIVVATTSTIQNNIFAVFEEPNGCIPLPVQFKSFNANRTSASNVAINWITASEQNSKGFNVQKNVGGVWKTIAFVPSQAQGGNSSSDLTYSYRDANNEKGITQYRIQQVDLDGNAKYSDIRAIRGEGTVGKIVVYPNPSVDGKLNVVFEDNSAIRDVQVNDMQGRVVKSYKGISNNILVIEKLTSGFYTIRITNRNTAATAVEKVVVK